MLGVWLFVDLMMLGLHLIAFAILFDLSTRKQDKHVPEKS